MKEEKVKYSTAVIIFGLISLGLAPLVIHKIKNSKVALACLMGLAIFASFPLRKLFGVEALLPSAGIQLAYAAGLFVIGFGWKRSWN